MTPVKWNKNRRHLTRGGYIFLGALPIDFGFLGALIP
jgi:hypothetical protein